MSPPGSSIPRPHPALPNDTWIFLILPEGWQMPCAPAEVIKDAFLAAKCEVVGVEYPCKDDSGYDSKRTFKLICSTMEEGLSPPYPSALTSAEKALAIAGALDIPYIGECRAMPYANYHPTVGAMSVPRVLTPTKPVPASDFPSLGLLWQTLRQWGPIYVFICQPEEEISTTSTAEGGLVAQYRWCIWVKFYYETDARAVDDQVVVLQGLAPGPEINVTRLYPYIEPEGPTTLGSENYSDRLDLRMIDPFRTYSSGMGRGRVELSGFRTPSICSLNTGNDTDGSGSDDNTDGAKTTDIRGVTHAAEDHGDDSGGPSSGGNSDAPKIDKHVKTKASRRLFGKARAELKEFAVGRGISSK